MQQQTNNYIPTQTIKTLLTQTRHHINTINRLNKQNNTKLEFFIQKQQSQQYKIKHFFAESNYSKKIIKLLSLILLSTIVSHGIINYLIPTKILAITLTIIYNTAIIFTLNHTFNNCHQQITNDTKTIQHLKSQQINLKEKLHKIKRHELNLKKIYLQSQQQEINNQQAIKPIKRETNQHKPKTYIKK